MKRGFLLRLLTFALVFCLLIPMSLTLEAYALPAPINAYGWNAQAIVGLDRGPVNVPLPIGSLSSIGHDTSFFIISGADFVNDEWYGVSNTESGLYIINTLTGFLTKIGGNVIDLAGFAYDNSEEKAYVTDDSKLYTIDLQTAALTLIGSLGDTNAEKFVGIACGNDSTLYGISIISDKLFTIDKTDASITEVGALGHAINYSQDIAFDRENNKLYGSLYHDIEPSGVQSGLYEISTLDGSATLKYSFEGADITGLAIPYSIDNTAPILTSGSASRSSVTASAVTFTSDELGSYYYSVVDDGAASPTIDTSGDGSPCGSREETINLSDLSAGPKDIYIKVKDAAGNVSNAIKMDIPAYNVCRIDSTSYTALSDALSASVTGDTITLLDSIIHTSNIEIDGLDLTLDLNEYNLYLTSGHLKVLNGDFTLEGTGEFNIENDTWAVYASSTGSAMVTNATSTGYSNPTVWVSGEGSSITVLENAKSEASDNPALRADSGGSILVKGNSIAEGSASKSIYAQGGGSITVEGNAVATASGSHGVYATSGGNIHVKGNVESTGNGDYGVYPDGNGSSIQVDGNVTGYIFGVYAKNSASAVILGNVEGKDYGLLAESSANIQVSGNVTATATGVYVSNATATVDGTISSRNYISIGGSYMGESENTTPTTKEGYLTYTNSENPGTVWVAPHDGSSEETAYEISTANQLAQLAYNVNSGNDYSGKYFSMTNDIDLSGMDWTPIGINYDSPFRGFYDGKGHKITNLSVNQVTINTIKYSGLFGAIEGNAVIKNLDVAGDISTRMEYYAAGSMAGGIVGYMSGQSENKPLIDNCSFTGNVSSVGKVTIANNTINAIAGGISGFVRDGVIKNCSYEGGNTSAAVITNNSQSSSSRAGGIAGGLYLRASILNCYTSEGSTISSTGSNHHNQVGGISGYLEGDSEISVSYSAGNVFADPGVNGLVEAGGILGNREGSSLVSNSYWIESTGAFGQIGNEDATAQLGLMSEANMKSPNFGNVLNAALDSVANIGLYKWEQATENYPNLSATLWTAPSSSSSSGGSNSSGGSSAPRIIVTSEKSDASTTVSTKIKAQESSGMATATISSRVVSALISKARSTGGTSRGDMMKIDIDAPADLDSIKMTMGSDNFGDLVNKTDASFAMSSDFIDIEFDEKAMEAIASAGSDGDISISASKVDSDTLSEKDNARLKGRPVYDFTVTNGDTKVSHFNGGKATIRIPYSLSPKENPRAIVVFFIADDGSLRRMRGKYDSESGSVVFRTPHFSKFAIVNNQVEFEDVPSQAWYKDAVDFIGAREITSGTSEGMFSPEGSLTRGQFVVLLMNAYEISTDASSETMNFADAGDTYYTTYLLSAKERGIVNGIGQNLFAPENAISRQEMCVMLYNALTEIGELPQSDEGSSLESYTDSEDAAIWAIEALDALARAKVINGNKNEIRPLAGTSRAEIAQVLYNLLSK